MAREPSIGLVVEGLYDEAVLRVLATRLVPAGVNVHTRPCGGKARLLQKFVGFLKKLEFVEGGRPAEKALIVCDADGRDCQQARQRLEQKVRGRSLRFPAGVHFCVVRQEVETWLLADEQAVCSAAKNRGGKQVTGLREPLEEILDAKGRFHDLLARAGLEPTLAIYE